MSNIILLGPTACPHCLFEGNKLTDALIANGLVDNQVAICAECLELSMVSTTPPHLRRLTGPESVSLQLSEIWPSIVKIRRVLSRRKERSAS